MPIRPTRLEGCDGHGAGEYVPECPALDGEVACLHWLARHGAVEHEHATRQLNTYLMAAAHLASGGARAVARMLVLPLTDAPDAATLPDLGGVLGLVLARAPPPLAIAAVLEQCIPSLRVPSREVAFLDSQALCINLVLALVLGTYPGPAKQPGFVARARLFGWLHGALTAPPEAQTRFCKAHEPMVLLACMEYLARVLPAYMPVHAALLTDHDTCVGGFFRKVPALCDEYRQQLDGPARAGDWPGLLHACRELVDKVSRFKRCQRVRPPRPPPAPLPLAEGPGPYLAVPALRGATPEEFALLGLALGLDGRVLHGLQARVAVHRLPPNLRRLQLDALARAGLCRRTAFFRTRRYLCAACVLLNRPVQGLRFRLDTLSHQLVCAACLSPDLLSVDLIGRALQINDEHYILCPGCLAPQVYCGHPRLWGLEGCPHAPAPRRRPARPSCPICLETASGGVVRRVDHLTGEMHAVAYCQRHTPSPEAVQSCANVRQLTAYHVAVQRSLPVKGRHARRHARPR
jgi:hypothetical protein